MRREDFARQKMTHHFTCPTSTADKAQNIMNVNYMKLNLVYFMLAYVLIWTDSLIKLLMGGKSPKIGTSQVGAKGLGAIDRGSTSPLICGTPHGMASRGQGFFFLIGVERELL